MLIAGIDEVGRGPLAGPVVAACVILDPAKIICGLNDSKKLSEKRREALFPIIQESALAWAMGRAEVEEIDSINILQASLLAMKRAWENIKIDRNVHKICVDGRHKPQIKGNVEAIIKGDSSVAEICAASILAKVIRDREMNQWHEQYPHYEFKKNKGYGTAKHIAAINEHGILDIHRRSFAPIKYLV